MKEIRSTLILFLVVNLVCAQNPLVKQWDKRFGGTGDDGVTCFQQSKDRGYILGGSSNSDSSGDKSQANWDTIANFFVYDYWLVKTDSFGNKQWDKNFGGGNDDRLFSMQQTSDGGYILGGFSRSGISGNKTQDTWGDYDYWIVKTDSFGNKEWDRDYGGTSWDELHSVQQTSDGGYILGGFSWSGISGDKTQASWGNNDYWIVKIDSMGNKQWDKDFGGAAGEELHSLQQTADGGYILGGHSNSGISGDKTQPVWGFRDYWIVKTDSLGNKQWDKDFGGTDDDAYVYSVRQTADGGYITGGSSLSGISGDKTQNTWGWSDYWIIKIDSLGNKQWDKDFGGTAYEEFYNIFLTNDGGYLFSGDSYSPLSGDKTENNLGQEQTWVIKTDSSCNKQWDKTIFTTGHDEIGLAIQTDDYCYALTNLTQAGIGGYKTQAAWLDSLGNPTHDYWIIKFCDTSSTTPVEQISNFQFLFSIYPNPAEKILTIALNKSKKITIINLLGEIMFENDISPGSNAKVDLDVSFLSPGIYFIKVDNEVKKFVKE